MQYYDRYQQFLINGEQTIVPNVTIPFKSTDKRYIYFQGKSRLDKISYEFYKTPSIDYSVSFNSIITGL